MSLLSRLLLNTNRSCLAQSELQDRVTACAKRLTRSSTMIRVRKVFAVHLLIVAFGCASNREGEGSPAVEAKQPLAPAIATAVPPNKKVVRFNDPKLRRSYDAEHMKVRSCTKFDKASNTLVGKGCQPGLLVYGPYVNAPAEADVSLNFEIRSSKAITVRGDVSADRGKQILSTISPQELAPNENKAFAYSARTREGLIATETRIWINGEAPIDFEIKNLIVAVR